MELVHHREGAGEPLVLIHGIGHHWQGWEPVIALLRDQREVIAIDLPGFGASPMPPAGTPAGIESLTALVSRFLDSVGLDRPHVAGNSLGGWIALELARQGRVASATGLSPAGFHNRAEGLYQRTSLRLARAAGRPLQRRGGRLLTRPRARRLAFGQLVAHPERVPAAQAAQAIRALAGAGWFDETLVAITGAHRFDGGEQVSVPVSIAWGERDRLLLPHQAHRAARAIPDASVITLRGCGHVPCYDDPQQVAQVLLQGSSGR
ncbi:MAG: alpha/beta fold hydrolase [Actinomycetota bacterium]|nr:alpha/beta fold hydrolase [Actinomycetota bacterium]